MLKKADVTAENMAPGTIERLGLGYDVVKKINPRIIYCQIQGFGTGSPYEKGLAFDMIAQAAGGPISVTGEPDRPPVKPGLELRRHRHRHADGDHDPRRAVRAPAHRPGPAAAGRDAGRDDPLHAHLLRDPGAHRQAGAAPRREAVGGNNAPSGLYPCKPRRPQRLVYITTSRANPEHWARLMKLIGREELIDDPRFATGAARVEHEAEVDAIITEWTRQHTKEEAMEQLISGVGVPAGAVFDTMELQNDPSFEERGIMQVMEHPNGDVQDADLAGAGRRQTAAGQALAAPGPAQRRGAEGWLGLDADEIAALKSEGVL